MGGGVYSSMSRGIRAEAQNYRGSSVEQNFKSRKIQDAMSPYGLGIRESRDSDEHPDSVAIIVALDVTGSMLDVPQKMVIDGLPHMMTNIIQAGTPDPQMLFLGIGDHEYDSSPIQVSQFESSDELLDKWLTSLWLEKGGGANDGESYMFAHYVAAMHTSIDCFEKRGEKGLLFTIGDEKVLPDISAYHLEKKFGPGQYASYTARQLITLAQEKYEVYHIHTKETGAGRRLGTIESWKDLLGQNVLVVESHKEIPDLISKIVSQRERKSTAVDTIEVAQGIPVPKDSGSTEGISDDITML